MQIRSPRPLIPYLLAGASLLALANAGTSGGETPTHQLLDTPGDPATTASSNDGDTPSPVPAPVIRSRYGKLNLSTWASLIPARVHSRVEWVWPVAEAMGARIDIQEGGRVVLLTSQERQSKVRLVPRQSAAPLLPLTSSCPGPPRAMFPQKRNTKSKPSASSSAIPSR